MIKGSARLSLCKSFVQGRKFSSLVYARRAENGQGGTLRFDGADAPIDVSYSTFWNDFTHYSFHVADSQQD